MQELMQTKTPDALLVFLSGCVSAAGDQAQEQPDETVHLAAATLFTGFQSVDRDTL
ncbi:hypothetical protein AcV7_006117 [Taiwanofungus camphoratus]|nr:hypothetical protein AcV7_006117 [Antrodia cinnamomea]